MVTWIMPVYNGRRYLRQAIASVLDQPCKALRLIIVDDGSVDETGAIADSFDDDRVTVIHTKNKGVSAARNLGLRICQG